MTAILVPPQMPIEIPCKIAFVGEAPSYEELEKRTPLVGPSGRLFNSLLRTAGIDRAHHMVTNVFSEQLPDNDVSKWCASLKEARAGGFTTIPPIGSHGFLRPEYHWHLDRLREELEACQPTVIVPLGGTALWSLTGQAAISSMRGTVLAATRVMPGSKLIPTFHPMAVQHQWKFYTTVVKDLQRAIEEADRGPDIYLPKRELILEPTLRDVEAFLPVAARSDLLSVDIETGWGQITCIGFAASPERAICIPFVDFRVPDRSYWRDEGSELAAWKLVRELLALPVPKLGQNFGSYDTYWLLEKYHLKPVNFLHDTRIMHHALYAELPKDLQFMGNSYAKQGAWKHWGGAAAHAGGAGGARHKGQSGSGPRTVVTRGKTAKRDD